MHIVHVNMQVKPGCIEAFIKASCENAMNSIKESGVVRFDVIQQTDDPTCFMFIEIYRSPEDVQKHKETLHFNKWVETAEPMMTSPRTRKIFRNLYPSDSEW